MGLVTRQEVKDYLRIPTAQTTDDTLIDAMILSISSLIKEAIGLEIEIAHLTEYYDGDCSDTLELKNYPVVSSVISLHDDVDRVYGADTLIDPADYVVDLETGIIKLDGFRFSKGKRNIKAVYDAGYDPIPEDIKLAVKKMVMAEYIESVGAINVIEGQDFVYKPDKLRKEAQKVIDRRRKIR